MAAPAQVHLRRVYENPDPADGRRVLVDRLWARGLTTLTRTGPAIRRACCGAFARPVARWPTATRRRSARNATPTCRAPDGDGSTWWRRRAAVPVVAAQARAGAGAR